MTHVVAFRSLLNQYFPVDFNIPGWQILDFADPAAGHADCYFQINVQKRKTADQAEYDFIRQSARPVLVCESNLFRKNSYAVQYPDKCYYRLGWGHFLRSGNFNNANSPADRWNHIQQLQNIQIKPWQQRSGHVLLCLQKPGDSTLNSLYEKYSTYQDWIAHTIEQIKCYSDRPIMIRPHLKTKKINFDKFLGKNITLSETWNQRTVYEGGAGLQKDFDAASAVVGYNSNALVESTCEGIPTFPLSDESVVWDISNKIEDLSCPRLDIDRTQWLHNAAYMIWNMNELNNGTAWNHLKGVYFND
jgi:hypothetical protein